MKKYCRSWNKVSASMGVEPDFDQDEDIAKIGQVLSSCLH